MDPFIGQLLLVPYNFAPKGWTFCDGRLLAVTKYAALFSLLGTTFGGDGVTTFGLPDLRGRVAMGSGHGPTSLQPYLLGQQGGTESVTLLVSQVPAHTHSVAAASGATSPTPEGHLPGTDTLTNIYDSTPTTMMSPKMIGVTGGNQPHENLQPYLTLHYLIATEGIYPSRE